MFSTVLPVHLTTRAQTVTQTSHTFVNTNIDPPACQSGATCKSKMLPFFLYWESKREMDAKPRRKAHRRDRCIFKYNPSWCCPMYGPQQQAANAHLWRRYSGSTDTCRSRRLIYIETRLVLCADPSPHWASSGTCNRQPWLFSA
jgi:hypothetical protein